MSMAANRQKSFDVYMVWSFLDADGMGQIRMSKSEGGNTIKSRRFDKCVDLETL